MKNLSVVTGFGAFLLLSVLSPANAATATTTPTSAGTVLGALEATLSFCEKVDPAGVPRYKVLAQIPLTGQNATEVALVRTTDAYEKEYGQITKQLEALTTSQAKAACNAH